MRTLIKCIIVYIEFKILTPREFSSSFTMYSLGTVGI
jgi:hypothetical protein